MHEAYGNVLYLPHVTRSMLGPLVVGRAGCTGRVCQGTSHGHCWRPVGGWWLQCRLMSSSYMETVQANPPTGSNEKVAACFTTTVLRG
jgi:hypothetical protein